MTREGIEEKKAHIEKIKAIQAQKRVRRCPDPEYARKMIVAIDVVRVRGDSVGGAVTCIVRNLPEDLVHQFLTNLKLNWLRQLYQYLQPRALSLAVYLQGLRRVTKGRGGGFMAMEFIRCNGRDDKVVMEVCGCLLGVCGVDLHTVAARRKQNGFGLCRVFRNKGSKTEFSDPQFLLVLLNLLQLHSSMYQLEPHIVTSETKEEGSPLATSGQSLADIIR
ncbi:chorismate synthase [Artemisia annua]|uniref:chorismate synthase n=1 Tax=Artemisia annua TaxID=35608 RepID=A0A2U1LGV3_ARTAN|nr:chorismate synthase [Artemisia annua]